MSKAASLWAGAKLSSLTRQIGDRLLAAGIAQGALEAGFMVRAVLGKPTGEWIDPDIKLDSAQAEQLSAMCIRREAREPLSHILGNWGFWSLDLDVTADVLTPRPETEILVQEALTALAPGPVRILDLGTGSGAIILALLAERASASGVGVDISPAALKIAKANGEKLGFDERTQWIEGGWNAALAQGPFDLVVSNPPYIANAVIAGLEPEVAQFEPLVALDGGKDGLDPYRDLLPLMGQYLKPGGVFVFEIGADQGEAVTSMAKSQGNLHRIRLVQDFAKRDRVVSGMLS